MSTAGYHYVRYAPEVFHQLSAPQRFQLEESLECVHRWMERDAPPNHWRHIRPAVEIVISSLMRPENLDHDRLATLMLFKKEVLQAHPDFLFMRYLWYRL